MEKLTQVYWDKFNKYLTEMGKEANFGVRLVSIQFSSKSPSLWARIFGQTRKVRTVTLQIGVMVKGEFIMDWGTVVVSEGHSVEVISKGLAIDLPAMISTREESSL